ncbi:hypothetical protein RJ639_004188 [Escallonia herrerae]|uniref:VQ domain-containing protein n=1 Tax=Escallonia herrerae TaxID=1293975 RepID=A0AA88WAY5_9ASTE|nr:hypothetical protein RJ639_004188 [Escallonia herrerae]
MDSGNSGSMQSSSGGENEEYDSRAAEPSSISPFLNPSAHFGSISNPLPSLFDPPSHNLDPFSHSPPNSSQNQNPLYNLDLAWSRNLRSDPTYADYTTQPHQSLLAATQGQSQGPFVSASSMPLQQSFNKSTSSQAQPRPPDHSNPVKNPKKRTRASRRAPTTVLTTDTANFRQMVQEFTGIPTAPFSASSPYSRKLDLFGGTGGPFYPLRPSAQKVQLSPFVSSSSPSPSFFHSGSNMASATTTTNNDFSSPSNLLLMQNQNPAFRSLLGNAPVFGAKSGGSSRVPSLDELGISGFPSSTHGSSGGTQENIGGYKLQSSAPASGFHHEKDVENVSSRGEGTVDSWICPSD